MIEGRGFEEISVGDYVLSGGEIAAFVLLDACVRLLPGVMGKEASGAEESFAQGLLEYPHYTRPGGAPRPSGSPARAARTSGTPIWPAPASPGNRPRKGDKPARLS